MGVSRTRQAPQVFLSVENVSEETLTHSLLCLSFMLIKLSVVLNKTEHEEGWCMCTSFRTICWTAQRQNPAHWEVKEKVGGKDSASLLAMWTLQNPAGANTPVCMLMCCPLTSSLHCIYLFILCIYVELRGQLGEVSSLLPPRASQDQTRIIWGLASTFTWCPISQAFLLPFLTSEPNKGPCDFTLLWDWRTGSCTWEEQ